MLNIYRKEIFENQSNNLESYIDSNLLLNTNIKIKEDPNKLIRLVFQNKTNSSLEKFNRFGFINYSLNISLKTLEFNIANKFMTISNNIQNSVLESFNLFYTHSKVYQREFEVFKQEINI